MPSRLRNGLRGNGTFQSKRGHLRKDEKGGKLMRGTWALKRKREVEKAREADEVKNYEGGKGRER